jgi:hypothetical protein
MKFNQICFLALAAVITLLGATSVQAAARYAVATGSWNSTATWSGTDGGASGASVPVAADDVTIKQAVTVTVSDAQACKTLTLNNASAVLTINSGGALTSGGDLTLTLGTINNSGTHSCNLLKPNGGIININSEGNMFPSNTVTMGGARSLSRVAAHSAYSVPPRIWS